MSTNYFSSLLYKDEVPVKLMFMQTQTYYQYSDLAKLYNTILLNMVGS